MKHQESSHAGGDWYEPDEVVHVAQTSDGMY